MKIIDKPKLLRRAKTNQALDQVAFDARFYFNDEADDGSGSVCAIGCLANDYSEPVAWGRGSILLSQGFNGGHFVKRIEREFGVPELLLRCAEKQFIAIQVVGHEHRFSLRELQPALSQFVVDFVDALPEDVDLIPLARRAWWRFGASGFGRYWGENAFDRGDAEGGDYGLVDDEEPLAFLDLVRGSASSRVLEHV